MKKFLNMFLFGLGGLVLVVCLNSAAFASASHDHHRHVKASSPFEGKGQIIGIHCLISGHSLNKPCPHHSGQSYGIATECGGSPFPKNPISSGFDSTFLERQDANLYVSLPFRRIISSFHFLTSVSLNSSSPPPKSFF